MSITRVLERAAMSKLSLASAPSGRSEVVSGFLSLLLFFYTPSAGLLTSWCCSTRERCSCKEFSAQSHLCLRWFEVVAKDGNEFGESVILSAGSMSNSLGRLMQAISPRRWAAGRPCHAGTHTHTLTGAGTC